MVSASSQTQGGRSEKSGMKNSTIFRSENDKILPKLTYQCNFLLYMFHIDTNKQNGPHVKLSEAF